mgnify:CR=1 FL=1
MIRFLLPLFLASGMDCLDPKNRISESSRERKLASIEKGSLSMITLNEEFRIIVEKMRYQVVPSGTNLAGFFALVVSGSLTGSPAIRIPSNDEEALRQFLLSRFDFDATSGRRRDGRPMLPDELKLIQNLLFDIIYSNNSINIQFLLQKYIILFGLRVYQPGLPTITVDLSLPRVPVPSLPPYNGFPSPGNTSQGSQTIETIETSSSSNQSSVGPVFPFDLISGILRDSQMGTNSSSSGSQETSSSRGSVVRPTVYLYQARYGPNAPLPVTYTQMETLSLQGGRPFSGSSLLAGRF